MRSKAKIHERAKECSPKTLYRAFQQPRVGLHRIPIHQIRMLFVGIVAPRAEVPTQPPSWHHLGPRDMPLEAKRSRHVAVAIPEVRVSPGIAVSPRQ